MINNFFKTLVLKIYSDRGVSLGNFLDILVRKSNCRFNKLTIYNFQEFQSEKLYFYDLDLKKFCILLVRLVTLLINSKLLKKKVIFLNEKKIIISINTF